MLNFGRFGLVGALTVALQLAGCSTLYSEARNKQGEELKAAYAKVELSAPIAASRKNWRALLDEQLKLEDELWRQYGLTQAHLAATSWTVKVFKDSITTRIAEARLEEVAAAIELKKSEVERDAAVKAVKDAADEVRVASTEYDAMVKGLSNTPDHAEKVQKVRDRLQKALNSLGKLQSAVGQEFISSKKLEGLNEFLTTFDGVRTGKGSDRLAIALALFPDIQDQIDKARLDAEKPRLLPLVMSKQLEQAKLAAAQRNVARIDATIDLQRQRLEVLKTQLTTLDMALKGLGPLTDDQSLRALLQPVRSGQVLTEAEVTSRIQAWRPLALYLEAQAHLRAKQNKLQHQVIALGYEEPLSWAESDLQQWKALLDPSMELLSLYGASGVKAKDVQDLINSLSLLWIAVKVN